MSGNKSRQPGKAGHKPTRRGRRQDQKEWRRRLTTGAILVGGLALAALIFWPRPQAQPVDATRLADDPSLGPATAPVTIIEYGDFGCTTCRAWDKAGVLDQVRARYGDQVRFAWRDFPIITAQSPKAAEAGQCAYDQGKFWEYHDLLFDRAPALAVSDLKAYAAEIGLDTSTFDRCLDSSRHRATVEHDWQDALARHFVGTPSFLVNNQPLIGPPSFEVLQSLIDPLLATGA